MKQLKSTTYGFALELFLHVGVLEVGSEIYTDRCTLMDRYGRIIRSAIHIRKGFTLTDSIFEEVYLTPRQHLQRLERFCHLVLLLVVQVALEFDQRSILKRVRNVPGGIRFRKHYHKTERISNPIAIAVVLAVGFVEACSLPGSPRVAEFVVAERSLQVGVFLTPTEPTSRSFGHLLDRSLPVPTAAGDVCK